MALSSAQLKQLLIDIGEDVSDCGTFQLSDSITTNRNTGTQCLMVRGNGIGCQGFGITGRFAAFFVTYPSPGCRPHVWDAAATMTASGEILGVHLSGLQGIDYIVLVRIPDQQAYCTPAWLEVTDLCGNVERGYLQPHCRTSPCKIHLTSWWGGANIVMTHTWTNPTPVTALGFGFATGFYFEDFQIDYTLNMPGGAATWKIPDYCPEPPTPLIIAGKATATANLTFHARWLAGTNPYRPLVTGTCSAKFELDMVVGTNTGRVGVTPELRGFTAEILSRSMPIEYYENRNPRLRYVTTAGKYCASTVPQENLFNTNCSSIGLFANRNSITPFVSGGINLCESLIEQWSGTATYSPILKSQRCTFPLAGWVYSLFAPTQAILLQGGVAGLGTVTPCDWTMAVGGAMI